jgi:hypothetical protein
LTLGLHPRRHGCLIARGIWSIFDGWLKVFHDKPKKFGVSGFT